MLFIVFHFKLGKVCESFSPALDYFPTMCSIAFFLECLISYLWKAHHYIFAETLAHPLSVEQTNAFCIVAHIMCVCVCEPRCGCTQFHIFNEELSKQHYKSQCERINAALPERRSACTDLQKLVSSFISTARF